MSEVLLGVTLPQFTDDRARFVDGVRRAESLGFDSLWVFDHLWPLSGRKDRPVLEAWTSLAWLAAATESVTIGTLVTRSSLRNAVVLTHMAAAVAEIAPGRLTIGIGSGDDASRDENEAFGIPYWSGADRIAQFEETLGILRDGLEGSDTKLWVGGRSDDALALAARYGDGWNGWGGTPERFAQDAASVVEYAEGRPIDMSWGGVLKRDEPAVDKLNRFARAGARHIVCTFSEPWRDGVYEQLANDVRPQLRAS